MWKQKIGISIDNDFGAPITDIVRLVKNIGFDAVSPVWNGYDELCEVVKTAEKCELIVQSLHAPFDKSADMWSVDTNVSTPAKEELMEVLKACAEFCIPIMVVHTWLGFDYTFNSENLNFSNFDELIFKAQQLNVKIAFENTEGEEYLFALMERYKNNDTVGFCWDSGHEMCYNHSQDLLSILGERLIMTHLNDNLGISRYDGNIFWTDDLHLLPFDGIADWDYNIERLKKSRQMDILNFELNISSKPDRHENDIYGQMNTLPFLTEVYKRACKIAYKYSK